MTLFSNTILFICSALRKSISSEIADFIEGYKHLKFPSITKQAFSKARQNISPQAFTELCRLFVEKFYSLNKKLDTWNGFNILAIDGTSLQVPDTKECGEYFWLSSNQNMSKTAVATASALYDIVVYARITKYRTSERKIAKQHIESIHDKLNHNKSIVIFDRGYHSYDMFDYLNSKGLLFLMRVSTSFKLAESLGSEDSILEYKVNGELKKEADVAIANDNKNKNLKSKYQANRNFILGQVFRNIINIITKPSKRKKILNSILEKAIKIRSQLRLNRSCERKNKHPRKKHHHNIKSCI